jgi:hypothetical protein
MLFESHRVALTNSIGLRIRLPGSVEVVEPVAESSRAGEEREKKERRKKSKGKGKGKERVKGVEEEVEEEVEKVEDLDERAARRVRLLEILARKKVDLEVLVYEIEGIEKMLEN